MIVNKLNRQLGPLNTCHTYIDLVSLTKAIHKNLGLGGSSSAARFSTEPVQAAHSSELKEVINIVGQAVRLPGDINDAESLWQALIDQRDDIMTPIPEVTNPIYENRSTDDTKGP
jgi:hypothetical protein